MRRRRRRHHARTARLRGRPERRRRHLRLVRGAAAPRPLPRRGGEARSRRTRVPVRARGRPGARQARAGRTRLAQRQPLRARRPRAERRRRRTDAAHRARGRLPRADRGDRVRGPDDRRDVRVVRPAGARVHRRRRPGQERAPDADLLGRAPPPAARRRLGRRAGARLGDPRGRRGRLSRRRPPRLGRDGQGAAQPLPARRRSRGPLRRPVRATTPHCTTTSAGAVR